MIIMLFTLILPSMMDLIFLLSPSYFQLVFFNFFLPLLAPSLSSPLHPSSIYFFPSPFLPTPFPLAHSFSSPLPPSSIYFLLSPPFLPTPFPPFPFPLLFRLPLPTNTPTFIYSCLSSPPPSPSPLPLSPFLESLYISSSSGLFLP